MALFSFRHSVKTFSPKCENDRRKAQAGQTLAHLRYITRFSAARIVLSQNIDGRSNAELATETEKAAIKRKGRACERFVIALPKEATETQREALVEAYANFLCKGQAPYIAAIHDKKDNDVNNPHVHLVLFDQFIRTGRRGRPKSVLGFARKNAIEAAAESWARLHNEMMTVWGYDTSSHISHLSYADQGIERIPTIHEGPAARATRGHKRPSKPEWQRIDNGKSRAEANSIITEINELNERITNARSNGLGRRNENDREKRPSNITQQREYGRGNGQVIATLPPPFKPIRGIDKIKQGDGSQTRPVGATPAGTDGPTPRFVHGSKTRPHFNIWRGSHRRIVRRIFRELVFLRDTLRARVAQELRRDSSFQHSLVADKKSPALHQSKATHRPRGRS